MTYKQGLEMTYQNDNAGHKLKVRLVEQMPGRLWRVEHLGRSLRFKKGIRLSVHESDLKP